MPNSLLCAFESGYNALAGVRAVDIDKWSTFKLVLRQLKSNEAKESQETLNIKKISEMEKEKQLGCKNVFRKE